MLTFQIIENSSHARDLVKILKTLPYVNVLNDVPSRQKNALAEKKLMNSVKRGLKQAKDGDKNKDIYQFLNEI
jgi:hypothetical protein